ncbi:GNAT family N-acetyltransferase [Actinopolymorpha sp. B9G3]|uniref:GNAT family N-acetyltransferase n=1 Tax=Actinopolymorpha sp. B9G3 TaxID=3158970 RepID=UPI0032D94DD4
MPKKQTTRARNARAAAREGEKFTTALRRLSSAPEMRTGDGRLEVEFSGEIFQWRGPAPYYFVAVPEEQSLQLKVATSGTSYHRGMLRVQARIGEVEWATSMWHKDGRYVLPIRDSVRKPKGLADGDTVTIHLTVAVPALEARQDPARARPARANRKAPQAAGRRQPGSGDDQQVGRSGAGAKSRKRPQVTDDQLRIVPANEATWEDLQAIFGTRGAPARDWCQRYKMRPKEGWATVGADGLASRLREQTACGQPESATTTGLVAYLDGEPVGWCAVDPRPSNPRLLSHCPVPWAGRTEDKTDDSVWAVTCFVTRAGFRRRGISRALARAAVDFARQRGARALEGYPHSTEVFHVGTPAVFTAAGFVEVSRPTTRRILMRIDF